MNFNHTPAFQREPKLVCQNIKGSSPYWRNLTDRIFHPLTERQFNMFQVGDSVRMRIVYLNKNKIRTYLNIVNISPYNSAKTILGSYNATDTFKGEPFTHVLVLRQFNHTLDPHA
jgi:hypothetical protein